MQPKFSMRIILFLVCFFTLQSLLAQNNDCNSAVLLTDTIYLQNAAPLGFGKIKELLQQKKYDSTSFKSEKNSVWFLQNKNKEV